MLSRNHLSISPSYVRLEWCYSPKPQAAPRNSNEPLSLLSLLSPSESDPRKSRLFSFARSCHGGRERANAPTTLDHLPNCDRSPVKPSKCDPCPPTERKKKYSSSNRLQFLSASTPSPQQPPQPVPPLPSSWCRGVNWRMAWVGGSGRPGHQLPRRIFIFLWVGSRFHQPGLTLGCYGPLTAQKSSPSRWLLPRGCRIAPMSPVVMVSTMVFVTTPWTDYERSMSLSTRCYLHTPYFGLDHPEHNDGVVMTLVFNAFAQISGSVDCRRLDNRPNIFEGIFKSAVTCDRSHRYVSHLCVSVL